MHQPLRFLLPAILVVLTAACSQKQPKPDYVYVDKATKEHFAFEPGSYWIYKDSISGRVDSAYVCALDKWMQNFNNYTLIGEIIQSSIVQVATDGPPLDSSRILIELRGLKQLRIYTTSGIGSLDFGGKNIPVGYPFEQGKAWGNDKGSIVQIIDKYSLAGKTYNKVAEVYQNVHGIFGQDAWLYINDSIGIIKFSIQTRIYIAYGNCSAVR